MLVDSIIGSNCYNSSLGYYTGDMLIFNPSDSTWSATACPVGSQDETSWVKLKDSSILALDLSSPTSERYIPSLGKWIADAPTPVNLFNANGELGGAFLLPNGKVFYIGGTNQTDLPPISQPLITGVSRFWFGFEINSQPPSRLCKCGKRSVLSTFAWPACRNSSGVL